MASRYAILTGNIPVVEPEEPLSFSQEYMGDFSGPGHFMYPRYRDIDAELIFGPRRSGKTRRLVRDLEITLDRNREARALFVGPNEQASKESVRGVDRGRNRLITCGARNFFDKIRGNNFDAVYIDEISYCGRSRTVPLIQTLGEYLEPTMPCRSLSTLMVTCSIEDVGALMSHAEELNSGRFRMSGLEWKIDQLNGSVPGTLG